MATKLLHIFSIFSILLITTVVSARPGRPFHPCNTLIVSTYSFSLHNPDPNPNADREFIFPDLRPTRLHHTPYLDRELIIHDLRPFRLRNPRHTRLFLFPSPRRTEYIHPTEMTDLPLSSFRDRTKDILSVVASLLFGAACGALTAGTMYLIWSLLNYRHGSYRGLDGFTSDSDDDDNNDDHDDDIFDPKKNNTHYLPMPASPVKEKLKVKDADDAANVATVAEESV